MLFCRRRHGPGCLVKVLLGLLGLRFIAGSGLGPRDEGEDSRLRERRRRFRSKMREAFRTLLAEDDTEA